LSRDGYVALAAEPLQSPKDRVPSSRVSWPGRAKLVLVNGKATDSYPGGAAAWQLALLEQYKLYVEMTERLAYRRSLSNSFFLTLHSAALTLIAVFWATRPVGLPSWSLVVPLLVALVLCAVWSVLIIHHRRLNRAKWAVIGAFEDLLPAQPFVGTEWEGLLAHGDTWRAKGLTVLEQVVPAVFALAYVGASVAAVVTGS